MDREHVVSTFEKIISVCKEDGCDFVDLTFEDAEQILAMLKEQNGLMLALDQSNAVNGYLNAEVERLNGLLKEQEAEIRQLRLALDIAKGTCKGIAFETDEKFMGDL